MSEAIIGLMAGFIALSGLVLLLLFKTSLGFGYKLVAVLALTLFYWVQYHSLQRFAGWPVESPLPQEFVLIASEVIEPDRASGEPGKMYWWVRESSDPEQPPRVYELPYEKQVHRQAAEVLQEQEQGAQFVGRPQGNAGVKGESEVRFERISKTGRHAKQ